MGKQYIFYLFIYLFIMIFFLLIVLFNINHSYGIPYKKKPPMPEHMKGKIFQSLPIVPKRWGWKETLNYRGDEVKLSTSAANKPWKTNFDYMEGIYSEEKINLRKGLLLLYY